MRVGDTVIAKASTSVLRSRRLEGRVGIIVALLARPDRSAMWRRRKGGWWVSFPGENRNIDYYGDDLEVVELE